MIVVAARLSAVVLPMPEAAFRSTVAAVTVPPPLIAPAEFTCTWSPSAFVVPESTTSPEVVVVSVTFLPVPPASTFVPTVNLAPALVSVIAPSVVVAVVKLTSPPPL